MSGMSGMGQVWRHMRTDRKDVPTRLDRRTVRRVIGFARPHRRLITIFLALTVVDACLVVVTPLLVQQIVDDGIMEGNTSVGVRARGADGAGGAVRRGPGGGGRLVLLPHR